jgi:hypothetical protein
MPSSGQIAAMSAAFRSQLAGIMWMTLRTYVSARQYRMRPWHPHDAQWEGTHAGHSSCLSGERIP